MCSLVAKNLPWMAMVHFDKIEARLALRKA
jgi:hypothetical protein